MMNEMEIDMTYTFDNELIRDLYKDAHGFRPSVAYMMDWDGMTDAEKQAEWDLQLSIFAAHEAREKEQAECNVQFFNARIVRMIAMGAKDRKQAIRWILDADGIDINEPDKGYICYQLGLPYEMEREFA